MAEETTKSLVWQGFSGFIFRDGYAYQARLRGGRGRWVPTVIYASRRVHHVTTALTAR